MKFTTVIDNITALKWGLSIQEAYLFDWLFSLPSWADKAVVENEIFYFASKNKAVNELPMLTDKPDTMYRYYKSLQQKELILISKIGGKDYISLTEKAKQWNGNKSEHSENNPSNGKVFRSKLGNKSEGNSENNPTYNNTKEDYNINTINKEENEFSIFENPTPSQKEIDLELELERVRNENLSLKDQQENSRKKVALKKEVMPKPDLTEMCRDFWKEAPDRYSVILYKEFLAYWTEKDQKGKERWHAQKFFDLSKRLATWQSKAIEYNQNKQHENASKLSNPRHKDNWNAEDVARDAIALATAHLR